MCAAMLFPLVESSLPEETLRIWQRTMTPVTRQADETVVNLTAKDRLINLMTFLGREVENEERIQMAKACFADDDAHSNKDRSKKKAKSDQRRDSDVATAAGLLSVKEGGSTQCLFCENRHNSLNCEKARNMDMSERSKVVKEKQACFKCLKIGHCYKKCHSKERCPWCSKGHCLLMCQNWLSRNERPNSEKRSKEPTFNEGNSCLANISLNSKAYLPILKVKIRGPNGIVSIRAVIDTGSHRSYVLENVARGLGYETIGEKKIMHLLFGGTKTKPRKHKECRIHIGNLEGTYKCDFIALQQEVICQDIPQVSSGPWTDILRERHICLSDTGEEQEAISLLIGADVAGKILTGRVMQINQGITALETKLGWTILGKELDVSEEDTALMVVSMFTNEASVTDLWRLDTLGITDPVESVSKEARQAEIKLLHQETTKMDEEGRYEVLLPWKENHPALQDNRDIAEKRLKSVTKKLKQDSLFDEYNADLRDWLRENIIGKVPANEILNGEYYLPHRPVIKQEGTTKIRPVFDASAKAKDSPSLNQCLETGPNLIEFIPALLHRFRERRIGVTADIAKAFLQINISPSDRDALRFLWWNSDGEIDTYRHRRVVFGVTSSPFLLGATIELHI